LLGGSDEDCSNAITVDSTGNTYITGYTWSFNYPITASAFDKTINSGSDAFVSKLNAAGSSLVYSSFLGGSNSDRGNGIAVDSAGNTYLTGYTGSYNFPTNTNAFDTTFNGGYDYGDVFVSKFNAAGSALLYSTFLGGSNDDYGNAIALDSAGNAYIIGYTYSTAFPTTVGAFDTTWDWDYDIFVSKLNTTGAALLYSTFLGGNGPDYGNGIAVDIAGNAYLTGYTGSYNFPTTGGTFDQNHNGGWYDVFISKLNTAGSALIFSTFLGGAGNDYGYSMAVDDTGCFYLTGYTYSTTFPITGGAFDTSYNGNSDVFVSKLNATGSALLYSTFIGTRYGEGSNDNSHDIAVDTSGNAYITGWTYSPDFPTTTGALDTSYNSGDSYEVGDAFVSKLDATGSGLLYSTFFGGKNNDCGDAIALDGTGNAYITGFTYSSTTFPITPSAFDISYNGYYDGFMSKINTLGSVLLYSTFFGGNDQDSGHAITMDSAGNAYIIGYTYSSDFPTTVGAYDITFNGGYCDIFVSKFNVSESMLIYSTFIGGSDFESGTSIDIDEVGNAYITGATWSTNFPTTAGAYDRIYNGGYDCSDVFITKLNNTGSSILYSTFLGGNGSDYGCDIAVDRAGNAYITGFTNSTTFPTTPGAFDTAYNSDLDAADVFVCKLNTTGSTLLYSTFIGGRFNDFGYSIALDKLGNAYITGNTCSDDFPITTNAFDTNYNGEYDVFISVIDVIGEVLLYSTFLGGSNGDSGEGIALDINDNVFVTGITQSKDFPTTVGAFDTSFNFYSDCFISKLSLFTIPIANFYGTPTIGSPPLSVQFFDLSVGNPSSWFWSFGDGSTSTVQHPLHVYRNNGNYNISLTVSNAYGTSTTIKNDYINLLTGVDNSWMLYSNSKSETKLQSPFPVLQFKESDLIKEE
jgi:PKD repeat protein